LALDYTLRHLYSALRNRGATVLAIRFMYQGRKWEADTADEAVRLRRWLEFESAPISDEEHCERVMHEIRKYSPWTPDVFWNFVRSIGPYQTKAVLALLRHHLWADELATAIGIDEPSLGGVLSGLSKQLKRLRLKPSDLYYVAIDWSNNERRRAFHLQLEFQFAAEDMGWPETERKEKKMPPPPRRLANSEAR
jgi:hypothetical protein